MGALSHPGADLVAPRSSRADLEALASGAITPAAYLEVLCDRIDACDPQLQAFVAEPGRRARLRSTAVVPGVLAGLAVGIKDILGVTGLPTRAGSDLPVEVVAQPQATVVTRLIEAGALVAGKTVTAEFAVAAPGPTRNPHDPGRTPGGSSSGSAAAVAAGMVPLAVGTQTIGSVIRPAAYCGVVGFRVTAGRIPTDGIIANAPTLDTVGVFAADVDGAELLAGVLCDSWDRVAADAAASRPPVLGVPEGPLLSQAEPQARQAFADQCAALRRRGVQMHSIPAFGDFAELTDQLAVLNRYELARTHAQWFPRWRDRYRVETVRAIEQGLAHGEERYAAALRWRIDFIARLAVVMDEAGIDAWVSPGTTGPAPRGLHSTGDAVMCWPYSLAGLPAVTLPVPGDRDGLPLGLQLAGRRGDDERLLAWASRIEACWPAERP